MNSVYEMEMSWVPLYLHSYEKRKLCNFSESYYL